MQNTIVVGNSCGEKIKNECPGKGKGGILLQKLAKICPFWVINSTSCPPHLDTLGKNNYLYTYDMYM